MHQYSALLYAKVVLLAFKPLLQKIFLWKELVDFAKKLLHFSVFGAWCL